MQTITDIKNSNRIELTKRWETSLWALPPTGISQDLMRHILAYEVQLKVHGDLDNKSKRALSIRRIKGSKTANRKPSHKLKTGAQIIREWNGDTHKVDVTPDGFEWRGQPYRSLSAIAKAITGAHWSGPRFFGLNAKVANNG